MSQDPALDTYVVESHDLLEQMEQGLLAFSEGQEDSETINAIFRAAHTIKGSAGLFGLDDIVSFTHVVESVLDQVRDGVTAMDSALVGILLRCRDHMSHLIDAAVHSTVLSKDFRSAGETLVTELDAYLVGRHAQAGPANPAATSTPTAPSPDSAGQSQNAYWHVSIRFGTEVFRNGMDPLSFVRYLANIGELSGVHAYTADMPATEDMDAESCYLGFEIGLRGVLTQSAVESAFEFVRDDCKLLVFGPESSGEDYISHARTLLAHGVDLNLILQSQQVSALQAQGLPPRLAVKVALASEEMTTTVSNAAETTREHRPQEARFIRLDAEKVDALINLVGELVIAGAGIGVASKRSGDTDLMEAASTLSGLVEEVRDCALQLRMVPIGATFNRFQRVVHDVSAELGKAITLVVSGAETELDKTMVERIGDPLTHLVRNAMDHGIEPAEVRTARGKAATGTLRLNAFHDGGSVTIEVADDGGGLDRERILGKARERGLVSADQVLSDKEVWSIIFEPGFSTASKISNLSGRGVGMDVVKRSISDLRGTVEVESQAGLGTTIRIRLPLTLAIIDGFMVGVGNSVFVVPLDMVEECIELTPAAREETRGHNYINLRGKVLPFIVAKDMFKINSVAARRQNILVLRYGDQRAGLVVDDLMGEAQTVIKPLGRLFRDVRGVCGSTILGDGRVALILDVPSLLETAQLHSSASHRLKAA